MTSSVRAHSYPSWNGHVNLIGPSLNIENKSFTIHQLRRYRGSLSHKQKMKLERIYFRQVYLIAVRLWLFQETLKPKNRAIAAKSDEKKSDFNRIRCPLCKWQPNPQSRWYCVSCDYPEYFYDGCGATWNTFATRGRCPGCSHRWRWTSCVRCAGWSRHEHWYESNLEDS